MGNVYFAEIDNNQIEKLDFADPPSLNFAATPEGHTSSDSLESVVIQNIGNSTLTGGGTLSDLLDFTVGAGPGVVPDCNGVLALVPGAECDVSLSFTPHSAGQLNATLTLSDNSLNGNPAIQTIQISGIGGFPPDRRHQPQLRSSGSARSTLPEQTSARPRTMAAYRRRRAVPCGFVVEHCDRHPGAEPRHHRQYRRNCWRRSQQWRCLYLLSLPGHHWISPASGPVGTAVTITGTGLLDREGDGVVTFNGIPAAILSQTSTSIQVDVPFGATTGPISVHANGDTVKSSTNFTVYPRPDQRHQPKLRSSCSAHQNCRNRLRCDPGQRQRDRWRRSILCGFVVEYRDRRPGAKPRHHRQYRRHRRTEFTQQRRRLHLLSLIQPSLTSRPSAAPSALRDHHWHWPHGWRGQSRRHLQRHSSYHRQPIQYQYSGQTSRSAQLPARSASTSTATR